MIILRRVLLVLFALLAAAFAVSNRGDVPLSLWPLPFEITVPVFVAVLGALAIGLIVGGGYFWLSRQVWRQRAKRREREAERARAATAAAATDPSAGGTPFPSHAAARRTALLTDE